jgi:hypothetical protein
MAMPTAKPERLTAVPAVFFAVAIGVPGVSVGMVIGATVPPVLLSTNPVTYAVLPPE